MPRSTVLAVALVAYVALIPVTGIALAVARRVNKDPELNHMLQRDIISAARLRGLTRLRHRLANALGQLRARIWWPAQLATSAFVAIRYSRLLRDPMNARARIALSRTYLYLESLSILIALCAVTAVGWSAPWSWAFTAWLAVILAVIALRQLQVLVWAENFYSAFRRRPGQPMVMFGGAALLDTLTVVVAAVVVRGSGDSDNVTTTWSDSIATLGGLAPNNLPGAILRAVAEADALWVLVLVNAMLVYALVVKQLLRLDRFRRRDEDKVALAVKYLESGNLDGAAHWVRRMESSDMGARVQALLYMARGEIDKAWNTTARRLGLAREDVPSRDEVWFFLWTSSIDVSIPAASLWSLVQTGAQRGVSDGTMALGIAGARTATGLDLTEFPGRLAAANVAASRYPVTLAIIETTQGRATRILAFADSALGTWDQTVGRIYGTWYRFPQTAYLLREQSSLSADERSARFQEECSRRVAQLATDLSAVDPNRFEQFQWGLIVAHVTMMEKALPVSADAVTAVHALMARTAGDAETLADAKRVVAGYPGAIKDSWPIVEPFFKSIRPSLVENDRAGRRG